MLLLAEVVFFFKDEEYKIFAFVFRGSKFEPADLS